MRKLLLLALCALFIPAAHAGPIAWAKRHPLVTKLIVTGAASGVYAKGLHRCRLGGVDNCQEGYGAAWAGFGTTVALDVVMQFVGQGIGGKTGNSLAYGSNATVLGWGLYQWEGGLNKPKEVAAKKEFFHAP